AKTLSVAPGDVGEAVVSCPTGRRVVGGGGGQSVALNTPRGYIQESGPVDETGQTTFTASGDVARAWRASVHNPPEVGAPTREFRVFPICATAAAPVRVARGRFRGLRDLPERRRPTAAHDGDDAAADDDRAAADDQLEAADET